LTAIGPANFAQIPIAGSQAVRPMPDQPARRRLVDAKQAAPYIDVSVHTLYTMVRQRRIPFTKVGRLVKFNLDLLDTWIKENTIMPTPQKGRDRM